MAYIPSMKNNGNVKPRDEVTFKQRPRGAPRENIISVKHRRQDILSKGQGLETNVENARLRLTVSVKGDVFRNVMPCSLVKIYRMRRLVTGIQDNSKVNTGNKSFKDVLKFDYIETEVINQSYIQK
jgi:hypothetical protein